MSFLNHTLACEDPRYCTLIMKNGAKITAVIDSIESSVGILPKFKGRIMGIETTYEISTETMNYIPEIKNVIFNDPATIVFWDDGTKTVVTCQPGDSFDPEKGLAMAIVKKTYGNKGSYCNKLKKWLPKEEPVDNNRSIFVPKEFTFTADIDKLSKSFNKGISDALNVIFKGTNHEDEEEQE